MSAPVGIAVIGLGVIGRRMLEQTALRQDLRVVSAWDLDAGARTRAQADFPELTVAADAAAAIAAPGVDVVYIGTPPGVHRHYARMASARGLKVFCEKPLAVDVDEGRQMVGELAASGTPSAVNFVYASAPAARALQRAIDDGSIGMPRAIDVHLFFSRWPRDWQASAQWLRLRREGGFTREVLSHFVFLMMRLFGDCRPIGASVDWPEDEGLCERALIARLDCNGVPALVTARAGGAGPDEVRFTVRGEQGALRLENWYELSRSDGSAWQPQPLEAGGAHDVRTAAYQAQLDGLVAFVRGNPHGLPDAAMALRVQATIEALLASAT